MITTPTIGARLERQRLDHRARRLERVVATLRERTTTAAPAPRTPLLHVVDGFERELALTRHRLSLLDG